MFRINKVYLKEFKNFKNQTFDFSKHESLTLLIGENASGKSNLIEAICGCFYIIYEKYLFRKKNIKPIIDTLDIVYKMDRYTIAINLSNNNINYGINVRGLKSIAYPSIPKRVVAIYSGEEDRLYEQYFKRFFRRNKLDKQIDMPCMLFLSKEYWDLSLFCLWYSDKSLGTNFLSDILGDISIEGIKVNFRKNRTYYLNTSLDVFIDNLRSKCEGESFTEEVLLKALGEITPVLLFQYLYISKTQTKPLIESINFSFSSIRKDQKDGACRGLIINSHDLRSLSEGQKKLILLTAAMEFAGQEDTLFLLDEPDAHIHLSNKHKVIDIVGKYTHNRHVIITTHSPTLCRYIENKDSIMMLENGVPKSIGDQIETAIDLVGDRSAIDIFFSTKHIIFVEGKLDKLYITKAKEILAVQYPNLEFDIYPMGGVDNFKHFGLDNLKLLKGQMILCYIDRDPVKEDEKTKLQQIAESYGIMNITASDNEFTLQGGLVKIKFYPSPNDPANIKVWAIEDYFEKKEIIPKYIDFIMNDRPHIENSLPTINCGSWKNKIRKECDIKKYLEKHYKSFTANEYGRFRILLDDIQNEFNSKSIRAKQ